VVPAGHTVKFDGQVSKPETAEETKEAEKPEEGKDDPPAPPPAAPVQKKEVRDPNYTRILNCNLPPSIRILAHAPVDTDFSPRFHCATRTYRYFFFRDKMDLDKMREAANLLKGKHDFRNFAKLDVVAVMIWEREIFSVKIWEHESAEAAPDDRDQMCCFEITGDGFLWHMVRNICAILFKIGSGQEPVDTVSRLLDVKATPRKPQFNMADYLPLVLWDCSFSKEQVDFPPIGSLDWGVHDKFRRLMRHSRIRSALKLAFTEATLPDPTAVQTHRKPPKKEARLFEGKFDASVEEKIAGLTGSRKKKFLDKLNRYEHFKQETGSDSALTGPLLPKDGFPN